MNISNIPNQAWVYFFKDKSWNILYIWKAKDLKKRVSQYFTPGSVWKQEMLNKADSVDFVIVKNESEALYLEDNLIKKHKPYYNNMLKWSNSYAYIKITKEEFPQIFITRMRINDWSTYIWPKHNTIHLKKFFQYIRQILQYRWCKTSEFKKWKLCSDYYFWLCKGWCIKPWNLETMSSWEISKDIKWKKLYSSPTPLLVLGSEWQKTGLKLQNLDDYKKIINYITSFFRGDIKPIQKEILTQIDSAVKKENFERAAKLRDIYQNIISLSESQTVVINQNISWYFFKIKKIWNYFVYVLLYFNEWKLIDIIRNKFVDNESDIASIVASISKECWDFVLDKEINYQIESVAWKSSNIKKLSKSDYDEIQNLIEWFFESYIMSTSFEWENLNNSILEELKWKYGLKNFPYHIECVDISHLSGWWTSGGISCMIWWLLEKKYYRRYKISWKLKVKSQKSNIKTWWLDKSTTLQTKWDDYESLKEVIIRRFKDKDFLANLFIIDWGKWQLWIIRKILDENKFFKEIFDKVDFISIGKGEARQKNKIWNKGKKDKISEKIFFFDENMDIKSKSLNYDQNDKIILKLRDEAHRFANKYREEQMKAEFK